MFVWANQDKLKEVKKHLSKTSEDFLSIFPDDIKEKLKGNFYIAGGCIYSLYNDKVPNDYDFFVIDDSVVKDLIAFLVPYITKYRHGSIATGEYNGISFMKSKYAITIGEKYQIICKYTGNPLDVIIEFDFKHNMYYYMPSIDYLGHHNKVSTMYLTMNEMYFNNFRCRDLCGVILRIPKFTARGMTISKKEIAKILTKLQGCINDENEKQILLDYTATQGY